MRRTTRPEAESPPGIAGLPFAMASSARLVTLKAMICAVPEERGGDPHPASAELKEVERDEDRPRDRAGQDRRERVEQRHAERPLPLKPRATMYISRETSRVASGLKPLACMEI